MPHIEDGVIGNLATVAQFHTTDNQTPAANAYGLFTGGVAQIVNTAGNLDRQRETGIDQQPSRGVATGAMQFAQEFLQTSPTSVAAGAATAGLAITNTTGFKVGGALNFEPGTASYESAIITAVPISGGVVVQFSSSGAQFPHTAPYTVQAFLFNQERDFSGEGPAASGIGAAMAAEFESNSGGPPLSTGLASGITLDADRNIQGKNFQQMAVTATSAGSSTITFTGNPWTSGLIVGQPLLLSVGANGAAVEEVFVSKNNFPAGGGGPTQINLVNPIINANSTFATFDGFGLGVPTTGATALGTEDSLLWLYDPNATDPKRPLKPFAQSIGGAGAAEVRSGGKSSSLNITGSTVIKAAPGRAIRVTVQTTTATAAITLNDTTTTGGAAAANAFHTIPTGTATGTVYYLDWPCAAGIVASFGTATGAIAVSFD